MACLCGLISDLKQTVRALRRQPGLVCYILAILGPGIGANAAIFSVVSAAVFERIPWRNSDRIVSIREINPEKQVTDGPISTADYLEWKERADAFELTSGFLFRYFNIKGTDSPERVEGIETDASFLSLTGVQPLLGRNFTDEEAEPGNDRVAILTYKLWQRRFAGDPRILGRRVAIEGTPYIIVGVLPSDFWMFKVLNHDIDLFVPLAVDRGRFSHGSYDINLYARLKPGITVQQAQAQLSSIYLGLQRKYPETNLGSSVRLVPSGEWNAPNRPALTLLLAAAGLVLLIACANIANLLMARATSRTRELAIRDAIGADRFRLTRYLLTESLMLSITGGGAGLLVSRLSVGLLNHNIPYTMIRRVGNFQLDSRVLGFTLIVSIITGVAFGLAPAISFPRKDLLAMIKAAGPRASSSPKTKRSGELLVAGEMAMTVVLLAGAALVIKGSLHLQLLDRGLDFKNILIMQVWLPRARYPEKWQVSRFYDRVLQQIKDLSGVQSASVVNFPPLDIISPDVELSVAGSNSSRPGELMRAEYKIVDPDYFRTFRIPLIEGRYFRGSDADETHGVVVISRSLARSLLPGQSPIGNSIVLRFPRGQDLYWIPESQDLPLSIVGIVGDINKEGLPGSNPNELYLPYMQNPSRFMHLIARTAENPLSLAALAADQIRRLDSDEPVFEVRTMDDVMSRSFSHSRISSLLIGSFSIVALVIASLGIYGVVSYSVARQRAEVGIRMALGARKRDILRTITGPTLLVSGGGILMGLLGAILAGRVLEASLFGVISGDRSTPLLVAAFVAFVSLAAAYLPARKAMNVDPVQAIRCE